MIVERDIKSAQHIFIPVARKMKLINEESEQTLLSVCRNLHKLGILEEKEWQRSKPFKIERKTIYLRSDPNICLERTGKRKQAGDQNITSEYIRELHEAHETWMRGNNRQFTIDTGPSDEKNLNQMRNIININGSKQEQDTPRYEEQ